MLGWCATVKGFSVSMRAPVCDCESYHTPHRHNVDNHHTMDGSFRATAEFFGRDAASLRAFHGKGAAEYTKASTACRAKKRRDNQNVDVVARR